MRTSAALSTQSEIPLPIRQLLALSRRQIPLQVGPLRDIIPISEGRRSTQTNIDAPKNPSK